jgi:ATP-dependent DNA helicase RecG
MPSPPAPPSGPARALQQLGLVRDIDRVLHLPLRYEDETRLTPWQALTDGEFAQVDGIVDRSEAARSGTHRGGWIVTLREPDPGSPDAAAADDDVFTAGMGHGPRRSLVLRFLNTHPLHRRILVPGARVRVRGEVRGGFFGLEMVHPQFRAVDADTPLPTTLTPVYPTVAALPQTYLRRVIDGALARADLRDGLGLEARAAVEAAWPPARQWPSLAEAVHRLHRPPAGSDPQTLLDGRHPARQRLRFEELVAQQLSQALARSQRAAQVAPRLAAGGPLQQRLAAALPFSLTAAQARVSREIALDLARPIPMHRLLQGDVGAGKTVVAAIAAAQVIDAGWQCALMAPTEILVAQHATKLAAWLEPLGVQTAWLSGSRQGRQRQAARDAVASGAAQLVIGTHAVIQDGVRFARLGLAVIDEQHRFGVEQRLALRRKLDLANGGGDVDASATPLQAHVLGMSATPIPRTLAMTLFADLDISTLDELPPGRTPIVTRVFADSRRAEVIERLRGELADGRQVYWVCPLVEAVEVDDAAVDGGPAPPPATPPRRNTARDRLAELSNVIDTHRALADALPGVGVGLLHGRLAARDKNRVMADFAERRLGVLVATTVIEVGVDVPNASVMVIEHAERFGLAQLHQLRGRVGRGAQASVCVLLYGQPLSPIARDRLRVMAETTDGFEIARRDLQLRGPGEFLGARQSGAALLRFADLNQDEGLIGPAREVAARLWRDDPAAAERQIERFRGGESEYLNA